MIASRLNKTLYNVMLTSGVRFNIHNQTCPRAINRQFCNNHDMIGPPDPRSKLRPIIRAKLPNESVLQRKLRLLQNDTQQWNQTFWSGHNERFVKERDEFKKRHNNSPTADEISVFYKEFLDKNWKRHLRYNVEWYKRNVTILWLSTRVNVEMLLKFLMNK